MLTPRQAFKAVFLHGCAERGLRPEEAHAVVKEALARLGDKRPAPGPGTQPATEIDVSAGDSVRPSLKQAGFSPASLITWPLGQAYGLAKGVAPTALTLGTGLAVAAPVAAGLTGGYLASKATEPDVAADVEDAQRKELIQEYRRLAEQAKRRAQQRQALAALP